MFLVLWKASPLGSNGDDRRQWRKQGGVVGAAALPSQALRASSPKGRASGVSVGFMLDEQSAMSQKR
ncbi:hypothetical protein FP2_05870 [Faecalibacterium prausnitzii L2-6]|uniref:Uncharacterized protein n=1 Tax=Faecalibacterium prausnitzii L2-6 TaxID=718252 RepID=D4K3X3_9FIRM|nr:hypothetical protein FP2_05870 [Faecalibacterium prausnitzii L2-6]